ncbi:MAG: FIST signal transduction protein [Saprospiraceae bacterium]
MISIIINDQTKESLKDALDNLVSQEQVQSILLYIGADFKLDTTALSLQLQSIDKTIIGGIFPEVIRNGERRGDSAILLGLPFPMSYIVVQSFDEDVIVETIAEGLNEDIDDTSSFLVFVDALTRNKTVLFDCLYNHYGSVPNYLGGGAGTLKFEPLPCVVSNKGMLKGAAVVATIPRKINLGVSHGWSPISTQLKVTEVANNEIISLDWKPAMEVYQAIIEDHSKKAFNFNDFFNSTKSYPFGIQKLNDNTIVRDPFKTENGRVFLLDDVDEGSYVQILYGNLDSLIKGASEARKKAENATAKVNNTLIIDCISRVLFMEDKFEEELKKLDPLSNSFGALTLGEIANNGDEYLDIYNKTAVVGIFE